MDCHTKTAKVYLQPHKAGKKWKPVWLSLFPQSSSGVGRLEIKNAGGGGVGGEHGGGTRRHLQPHVDRKLKVVRLSELLSVVRLPPNAEACPMENMSAFCVETQDRTMVFAALKDDCMDWVEKLCQNTFQKGATHFHIEENQIYASADEASDFWVVVQETDAATRCGLQGPYWLQVGDDTLLLRDTQTKNIVKEWPYELLRRYGKDKMALTIEAGRRCDSGPGSFIFETLQAEKIFSMIRTTIRNKTSNVGPQTQESEKVSNMQCHTPLSNIPDVSNVAAALQNTLRTQDKKCAPSEDSTHVPITLMPLPLVPTLDSHSGSHEGGQREAVYANPAEHIQSEPEAKPFKALYVDPANVLPLQPPSLSKSTHAESSNSNLCIDCQDSLYSEVFDKISAVHVKKTCSADEPIYAEPVSEKEAVSHVKESEPDLFAHLYAQVCKAKPLSVHSSSSSTATSCSTMTSTIATDQAPDDVIYENMGII